MIEPIPDLPDNVVGFSATDSVSGDDYANIIVPAVERALARHDKLNLLYRIGPGFTSFEPAALWQDAKLGMGHLHAWHHIAVVTDVEWIRVAMQAFGFLMHGQVRLFHDAEFDAARAWVCAVPAP